MDFLISFIPKLSLSMEVPHKTAFDAHVSLRPAQRLGLINYQSSHAHRWWIYHDMTRSLDLVINQSPEPEGLVL